MSRAYHRHGATYTSEYRIWQGMLQRCTNPSSTSWPYYGERGIKVCDRWADSFEAFLDDMGPRPSMAHTIDRFPDNDGNYEPGNCRWATRTEQQRNTRWSRSIDLDGCALSIGEAADQFGLARDTIADRLDAGFTARQAIGIDPITTLEWMPNKSSRHEGVCWDRTRQKWMAYVRVDGKMKNLGRFDDEDVAGQRAHEARYPEKFTQEQALHRDLDAERAALEELPVAEQQRIEGVLRTDITAAQVKDETKGHILGALYGKKVPCSWPPRDYVLLVREYIAALDASREPQQHDSLSWQDRGEARVKERLRLAEANLRSIAKKA